MTAEQIPVTRVEQPVSGQASISHSPGSFRRENLPNGNIREISTSKVSMNPKDIPIAKKIWDKYKLSDNGGWTSEIGKKAQKEFFKQANAWRKKASKQSKVEEKAQEAIRPNPELKTDIARRWQIALCNLARGKFSELPDNELRDAALLSVVDSNRNWTLNNFKELVEGLEHGER